MAFIAVSFYLHLYEFISYSILLYLTSSILYQKSACSLVHCSHRINACLSKIKDIVLSLTIFYPSFTEVDASNLRVRHPALGLDTCLQCDSCFYLWVIQ